MLFSWIFPSFSKIENIDTPSQIFIYWSHFALVISLDSGQIVVQNSA